MNDTFDTAPNAKPKTDQERRQALRDRIEAGEQRHAERTFADEAKDALDNVTEFAKKHPLAVVGGAVGLGLLIGVMTRPGRRLTRRTRTMAALAGESVLASMMGLIDRAETAGSAALRSGSDSFEDISESIGAKARRLRREAAYRADSAGDSLRSTGRLANRKTSRGLRDLRSRFSN